MQAIVSATGSVQIPESLRQRLGIQAGSLLDLRIENDRLVMRKLVDPDCWNRLYGALTDGRSSDAIMTELRDRSGSSGIDPSGR